MLIFTDTENKIAYFSDEENHIYAYYNPHIGDDGYIRSRSEERRSDASSEESQSEKEVSSDDENNELVGEIEVTESDEVENNIEFDRWLDLVEVKKEYQQQGIGTQLVELAIEHLELRKIMCIKETQDAKYSLSVQGEFLIARCIERGIVSAEMCVFQEGDYDSHIVQASLLKNELIENKEKNSFSEKKRKAPIENKSVFFDRTQRKITEWMKKNDSPLSKKKKESDSVDEDNVTHSSSLTPSSFK